MPIDDNSPVPPAHAVDTALDRFAGNGVDRLEMHRGLAWFAWARGGLSADQDPPGGLYRAHLLAAGILVCWGIV